VAGRLMSRLEHYKRVPVLAMPIGIVALIVLSAAPGEFSLLEVGALLAIAGAGMGPMYPTTTVMIQNAVPLHQLGIATGTLSFFRQLGGAIIVAIFAAIVLGGRNGLTLDKLAGAGVGTLAPSFRWVFIAAAGFLAIALLALLAIREQPLRGPAQREAAASEPAK